MTKSQKEILEILVGATEENIWFTISDLVAYSGKSEKTVRDIIRTLETNGFLEVESPSGEKNYKLKKSLKNAAQNLLSENNISETDAEVDENELQKYQLDAEEAIELIPGEINSLRKKGDIKEKAYWGPYQDLVENREDIRKNLEKYGGRELKLILDELTEEFSDNKSMNPFENITLTVKNGIIDGQVKEGDLFSGWLVGTASQRKSPTYSIKIGKMYIPIDFTISAAYGFAQEWNGGKPMDGPEHKYESFNPNTSTNELPPAEPETTLPEDRRGVPKLLREMVHYELDYSIIDKIKNRNGNRNILLRKGALIPSELHPGDLLDTNKRNIVLQDYHKYDLFVNKLHDNDFCPFGVVIGSDPGRSIFSRIIDEIHYRETQGTSNEWKRGKLAGLDDNKVLGILLNQGEYTAIIKKNPMLDIRRRIYSGLKRDLGLTYKFYEEYIEKMKTYSFFLGPGVGNSYAAIRYEFPVKSVDEDFRKAIELRERYSPFFLKLSSPFPYTQMTVSKVSIPRVVGIADERAQKHLDDVETRLLEYCGGTKDVKL